MRRFYFVFAWILLSLGVVLSTSAAIHFYTKPDLVQAETEDVLVTADEVISGLAATEVQPESGVVQGIETTIEVEDARASVVANFLERHNSPLEPYDHFGQVFVDIADRYEFDFRLLPAIAMQESNLCKKIPENSYNCLGFGIHERGTLKFDSYEANFERAGRELKLNYIDQGRSTPEEIMRKYTPSSDGSWANSVNQWMSEMRFDDRQEGKSKKSTQNVLEFAVENSDSNDQSESAEE